MSKFLLNLILQISKALVNSKIKFLIQKLFSLLSARPTPWPVRPPSQPAHQPHRPRRPKQSWSAHLARASVASSWETRFPFWITPSRAGRLSLVSLSTGAHLSDPPIPRAGRPRSEISSRHRSPAQLPRASDAPELLQPSLITLPP
jgi:hypothetical protein